MTDSLLKQLEQIQKNSKGFPPVHLWNPGHVYDFDMRIDQEGQWFHEGTKINRLSLVKLFASILKKEGDEYFLVTPEEKARIRVEDVPFMVVEMEFNQAGKQLLFRTNLDEVVLLSKQHELLLRSSGTGSVTSSQQLPYINVRSGLLARFNRNVYYQAIECAQERQGMFYLSSEGSHFCVGVLE